MTPSSLPTALAGLLLLCNAAHAATANDPRVIVVGAHVDSESVEAFEESRGREPTRAERADLHRTWLDDEMLYREGLAMQLDKDDDIVRARVIARTLSVMEAKARLPPLSEQHLRDWFESQRARYDEPARYDFQEAPISGDASEAAARGLAMTLNTEQSSDTHASVRVFVKRPHANIVQSYGAELANAFRTMKTAEWQAVRTRDSWRTIRLDSITPAKPAVFENVRGAVMQDWKKAMVAQQRDATIRDLAYKYEVVYEPRVHRH